MRFPLLSPHRDGADPAHVGHAILSDRGEMLQLDTDFCAMLRTTPDALIGRSVLDVTAPEHRQACAVGMSHLRDTSRPFVVRKRMLCGDGNSIWVEQTTAASTLRGARTTILATFVPIAAPEPRVDPAALLDHARFLRDSRRDLHAAFGPALFGDPAWDLLLDAYIVEAEGGAIDTATGAAAAGIAVPVAARWGKALAAEGLFEREGDTPGIAPRYRLTGAAHARIERYLTDRLGKLTDRGVLAAR